MVAVSPNTMNGTLEENDQEEVVYNKQNGARQVTIYDCGKPALKIEMGTTLEVVKLLYEAENDSSRNNILGVRPRSSSDIPCIVTLHESKLEEAAYDIIVKDKRPSAPVSPNGYLPQERSVDRNVTTRCIDCSREAWKSKRYTSVGMNTEISINPLMEIDSLRSMSLPNSYATNHQTNTETLYPTARNRGGRALVQRPVPIAPPPGSIVYSTVHTKDYVVTSMPPIPPANSIPASEIEYLERNHYRSRSPRTSPVHIHGSGHTKICYPPMSKPAIDLDSVPYETVHAVHHRSHYPRTHSPNHQPNVVKAESEKPSPRRARSRSPIIATSNGYYKKEPFDVYLKKEPTDIYQHTFKPEEPRKSYRNDYLRSPGRQPQYERPLPVAAVPARQRDHASEGEPPVYVLPNDFDLERDHIDPHIIEYHPRKSNVSNEAGNLQSSAKHSGVPVSERDSPISLNASDSGKSGTEENQQPEVPAERQLSCKICKQNFPTKSTLYKHLRGHTSDEKPFKCNECGQGFTLSSNLRQHRIIHRGYKPFQCEYCGKKFMRSNVYKQHRRIHTGEQMHKCDLCPSEFLQKYALIKHMKKTHNIETFDN